MENNPAEESYLDVQRLIWTVCNKYKAKYGGEIDELESQSSVLFMEAYYSYKPDLGKFAQWVAWKVWFGLLTYRRKKNRGEIFLAEQIAAGKDGIGNRVARQNNFLFNLRRSVSAEAGDVLSLIFDIPNEIQEIMMTEKKSQHPQYLRAAVKSHLEKDGWRKAEIREAFNEIREAIKR